MTKIIILLAGLALIAFIAWWFYGSHEVEARKAAASAGGQSIDIKVKGGYLPEKVILKKGVPATLNFKRVDSSTCLDHVVFSDLGVNEKLPLNQTETVKFDTSKSGEYEWTCGMNMFHGKVIVK